MKTEEKNTSCERFTESLSSLSLLSGISSIIDITGDTFLPLSIRYPENNNTLLGGDMVRIGNDFKNVIKRNDDLKEISL